MNENSKEITAQDKTTSHRQKVNSILRILKKNGHNPSDMILIHIGLENGQEDLVSEVKEAYKVVQHHAASTKAHEILTQGKFKCKKNTSPIGDPEAIESGHALKLMHDGQYLAIIVDTKNPFKKIIIQSGIMFLPKHWTGGKKTVKKAIA